MLKNKNREKPVKNRNKLIDLLICLILAGGLILGLALDIVHDRTNYRVEFYQLSSKRISGSLRIVFLTDLHLREYGEGNSELAEDIESLSPDLTYDALISVRPYRDGLTHDEAIRRICSGECGVFNPLLLGCLRDIEGCLREAQ